MFGKNKDVFRSRRDKEKIDRALRRFDRVTLLMIGCFIVSSVVCHGEKYDLGSEHAYGFALWFLLFFAYVPLGTIGVFSWMFHLQDSAFIDFVVNRNPVLCMGVLNVITMSVIWLIIRYLASRRGSAAMVDIAYHLTLISFVWGCFQLVCMTSILVWNKGGLAPLHQHFNRPEEPERVIVVESDQK